MSIIKLSISLCYVNIVKFISYQELSDKTSLWSEVFNSQPQSQKLELLIEWYIQNLLQEPRSMLMGACFLVKDGWFLYYIEYMIWYF